MRTEKDLEDALCSSGEFVFRLAVSIVRDPMKAEDIRQNVFLKYYLSEISFENDRAQEAWLAKVTVNEGRSLLRSAWYNRHVLSWELPEEETDQDPATEIVRREEILSAMQRLPTRYRAAIHLVYYEGYSLDMLADIFGIKPGSAAALISRARKALKKELSNDYEG